MVYYKQTVIVDGSLTHADVLPYPSQPSSLMRNGRLSSLQTLIAATLIPASFALAKQAIVNHVQFARLVDTSIPELLGCSFLGAVSSAYIAPATEESGVNLSLCPVCVGGEPMLLADKALSLGGLSCSTFGRTLAPPRRIPVHWQLSLLRDHGIHHGKQPRFLVRVGRFHCLSHHATPIQSMCGCTPDWRQIVLPGVFVPAATSFF